MSKKEKLKYMKSCINCKYNDDDVDELCIDCVEHSRWEGKKKRCVTCKYTDYDIDSEPCNSCNMKYSNWEPKAKEESQEEEFMNACIVCVKCPENDEFFTYNKKYIIKNGMLESDNGSGFGNIRNMEDFVNLLKVFDDEYVFKEIALDKPCCENCIHILDEDSESFACQECVSESNYEFDENKSNTPILGIDFDYDNGKIIIDIQSNKYLSEMIKGYASQRQKGINKYATVLEQNDDSMINRLDHINQELMDALMYIEWAKDKVRDIKNI